MEAGIARVGIGLWVLESQRLLAQVGWRDGNLRVLELNIGLEGTAPTPSSGPIPNAFAGCALPYCGINVAPGVVSVKYPSPGLGFETTQVYHNFEEPRPKSSNVRNISGLTTS
jgi:hypothetical protein